jgi:ABC-type antimicrobial peptide transport system permease subunit
MAVRVSSGDPLAVLPAIRARLGEIDPAVPLAEPRRLADVVGATLADERFRAVLVAALAVVALVLAALGVYAVTAYAVATQEREHGVRLALGASPGELTRTVLSGALRPAMAGVVVGGGATIAGGRLVNDFLYGVEAGDPGTLMATAGLLLGIAVVAALGPARRAARTDPAALLRAE